MNMSVPSCPLALTNPIQLHTLRCSGGACAPKSSHRHAKTCLWTSRYSVWYVFHLHRWTDSRPNWRQLQLETLGKSCAKVEATSDRQIVFLLERQRQAPFYIHGNQYACVHACSGQVKVQVKFSTISSKCAEIFATHIGNYKQNILAVLFCRSHCKCPQKSQFL